MDVVEVRQGSNKRRGIQRKQHRRCGRNPVM